MPNCWCDHATMQASHMPDASLSTKVSACSCTARLSCKTHKLIKTQVDLVSVTSSTAILKLQKRLTIWTIQHNSYRFRKAQRHSSRAKRCGWQAAPYFSGLCRHRGHWTHRAKASSAVPHAHAGTSRHRSARTYQGGHTTSDVIRYEQPACLLAYSTFLVIGCDSHFLLKRFNTLPR